MSGKSLVKGGLGAVALFLALAVASPAARAERGEFVWDPIQTIDSGDIELSTPAGRSVAGRPNGKADSWDVVFLRAGRVHHAKRTGEGWSEPVPISPEGMTARSPQIAWAQEALHAVWEADEGGIPEIWTSQWEGGSQWSAPICLTGDGVASTSPSLDGDLFAVLAWEDEQAPGSTRVHARIWNGSWGPAVPLSPGGVSASEPSASAYNVDFWEGARASVAWTDGRHGDPEIYSRAWDDTWQAELRLTELDGGCLESSLPRGSALPGLGDRSRVPRRTRLRAGKDLRQEPLDSCLPPLSPPAG